MLPLCRRSGRLQSKPSGKQDLVGRESEDDVTVNSGDGNSQLFTTCTSSRFSAFARACLSKK
jgi:hypothetical protein